MEAEENIARKSPISEHIIKKRKYLFFRIITFSNPLTHYFSLSGS
jgi:hypothetical protein